MKKFFFLFFYLVISTEVFAQVGARYYAVKRIYDDPSILEEPILWGVIVFIIICVIIYNMCKDKK